jgi:hypothetical protein
MKKRELARRVEESGLLRRLGPSFALSPGPHVIHVAPVEHILAGFSFETIYVAHSVRVQAFAMALVPPPRDYIAYHAMPGRGFPVWDGDVLDEVGLPVDLVEAIVAHVPFVLAHSRPRRFLRSRRRTRGHLAQPFRESEAYLRVAAGSFRRARRDVKRLSRGKWPGLLGRIESVIPGGESVPADAQHRAQQMLHALHAGPGPAQSLLRQWEDETLSAIRVPRRGS